MHLLEHGALVPLLRISSDTDAQNQVACQNSLKALLYMTSSGESASTCIDKLLQANGVARLVELILGCSTSSNNNTIINLACGLLANLTRTEQGTIELVGFTLPKEAIAKVDETELEQKDRPTMELLLERYLNGKLIHDQPVYDETAPHEWDTMEHDPYQHFAAILMNATQAQAGRQYAMRISTGTSVLERLVPQLQHSNPIRRRGISGLIRNCCLETDAAWWLLNQVKLITPILYPLAGPEELDMDEKQGMDPDLWLQGPDKQRELDGATRLHLVESILLLCASGRQSREALRLARTYVILKYADMVEELENVSEQIDECVQYLRRDEEGTEEGSSDQMVEEAMVNIPNARQLKLLTASSAQIVGSQDYDDVD